MGKILTIAEIKSCVEKVAETFGVVKVILFGSYATGSQTTKSDLDFLVEFKKEKIVTLLTIAGLKLKLEELTGKAVDIIKTPVPKDSILEINTEVLLYAKAG